MDRPLDSYVRTRLPGDEPRTWPHLQNQRSDSAQAGNGPLPGAQNIPGEPAAEPVASQPQPHAGNSPDNRPNDRSLRSQARPTTDLDAQGSFRRDDITYAPRSNETFITRLDQEDMEAAHTLMSLNRESGEAIRQVFERHHPDIVGAVIEMYSEARQEYLEWIQENYPEQNAADLEHGMITIARIFALLTGSLSLDDDVKRAHRAWFIEAVPNLKELVLDTPQEVLQQMMARKKEKKQWAQRKEELTPEQLEQQEQLDAALSLLQLNGQDRTDQKVALALCKLKAEDQKMARERKKRERRQARAAAGGERAE
ncbi:hypothetical protein LTR37_015160 [Vermiconidia calcicola]|uniref:Uncharacterized protein n=1 Tax=Vermiconidia calcicola TaxID=1690605 RepID=A0ACC3MUD0_9PEZI|nr:hypothetical protein LTR37_015160 [Vermiconidia calcicola]